VAELVLGVRRRHWGIENQRHHRLDLAMKEDQCRVRGLGAIVLTMIRKLVMMTLDRLNLPSLTAAIRPSNAINLICHPT
jgi:predicted transposase YbfD/YdcC